MPSSRKYICNHGWAWYQLTSVQWLDSGAHSAHDMNETSTIHRHMAAGSAETMASARSFVAPCSCAGRSPWPAGTLNYMHTSTSLRCVQSTCTHARPSAAARGTLVRTAAIICLDFRGYLPKESFPFPGGQGAWGRGITPVWVPFFFGRSGPTRITPRSAQQGA